MTCIHYTHRLCNHFHSPEDTTTEKRLPASKDGCSHLTDWSQSVSFFPRSPWSKLQVFCLCGVFLVFCRSHAWLIRLIGGEVPCDFPHPCWATPPCLPARYIFLSLVGGSLVGVRVGRHWLPRHSQSMPDTVFMDDQGYGCLVCDTWLGMALMYAAWWRTWWWIFY